MGSGFENLILFGLLSLMLLIGKLKPRATDFILEDSKAVDLTPWKYSKLVSVIVIVCVLLVYLAFSPLGIGA